MSALLGFYNTSKAIFQAYKSGDMTQEQFKEYCDFHFIQMGDIHNRPHNPEDLETDKNYYEYIKNVLQAAETGEIPQALLDTPIGHEAVVATQVEESQPIESAEVIPFPTSVEEKI